jgi:acylpyruvate hydrolase
MFLKDMTARDKQNELKKNGLPWLLAKGFDTSCPLGDFIEKKNVSNENNLTLKLLVNGVCKQNGNTKDMLFNIPTLISFISDYITLEHGDILLTGTPAGVGPVKHGDVIEAELFEEKVRLSTIKFSVVDNSAK